MAGRVDFATNSMVFPSAIRRNVAPPDIHISQSLAQKNELVDGDIVRLSTGAGRLEGSIRIDADLKDGTVWMNHGWLGRNVNHLLNTQDVDSLTTQPYFSSIPVKIEKVI